MSIRSLRPLAPYLTLLLELLYFFRLILFHPAQYTIPWDFQYYAYNQFYFLATAFRAGRLPLWDPFIYGGIPFYANITAQVFYPPTLLTALLASLGSDQHLLLWMALELVAHIWLAGAATFLLLRAMDCNALPALLGATCFQLGCYFASQTQHFNAVMAAAWLPLIVLAILRLARPSIKWTVLLSVSLAASFLAGFPATTFAVLLGSGMLVLMFRSVPLLLRFLAACLGAAVLASIQILTTAQLTAFSIAKYRGDFRGGGGGFHPEALVSLVWPNYFHVLDQHGYHLPYNFTFLYIYCGLLPLGLAVFALWRRESRYTIPFALLTALVTLVMFGESTRLGEWLLARLLDLTHDSIYPEFFLAVFSFGVAVLAGLGAQQFAARPAITGAMLLLTAADLTHFGSSRPMNTRLLKDEAGVTAREFDGNSELLETVKRFVHRENPPSRLDTFQDSMSWQSMASTIDVPSAGGNEPFASARYMDVRRLFTGGERWNRYYEVRDLDSPILDLLNIRYLIARAPLPPNHKWRQLATPPGHLLYENPAALPRFFLVRKTLSAVTHEDAVAKLGSAGFRVREDAVVEQDEAAEYPESSGCTVKVVRYEANEVELESDCAQQRFLVTSEGDYPGWTALLNGTPTRIVLTNVAFRGVHLPAGHNRVLFRFFPYLGKLDATPTHRSAPP